MEMKIRTVKPEFWINEELSDVSAEAALLAIGLLNYADDEGWFKLKERVIQAVIFPMRRLVATIDEIIEELADAGYIEVREDTDGNLYGHIVNFNVHQRIRHPTESIISPLFCGDDTTECQKLSPEVTKEVTDQTLYGKEKPTAVIERQSAVKDTPEGKEGKGKERKGGQNESSAVRTFVLTDGTSFEIDDEFFDELSKAYPGLDIKAEIRALGAWNYANPNRRKTRKGARRHVNAWMKNAYSRLPPQPKPLPQEQVWQRKDEENVLPPEEVLARLGEVIEGIG